MKTRMNKDELISKTGEIADAFSVFIAAGGNVAVWVLFVCMIANIIDAAVNFPTVVSVAIMVIQAVVLDIAGFGLLTITKRLLKVNDEEAQEAARKGKNFAGWLIVVMIVTMILITSKTLSPVVVPIFTQDHHWVSTIQNNIDVIDKVLVLARIGFTVAYVHIIHNLREIDADLQQEEEQQVQANDQRILAVDKKVGTLEGSINTSMNQLSEQLGVVHSTLPQVVQSQVQQVVQSLIPSLVQQVVQAQSKIIISEIQGVVHPQLQQVHSQMQQAVRLIPETVQEHVQILMAEQMQPLFQVLEEGNSSTALQELAERLQEVSTSVSEMRTTITEVRTVRQVSEPRVRAPRASSKVVDTEPIKGVQSPGSRNKNEPPTELLDEPVEVRVKRFISEQIELGNKPSLNQIVNQCQCSKNTAIRYRRELLPENEEGSSETPEIVIDTDSELVAVEM